MFTAKIQNRYGELIELTHNPDYTVVSIDGLAPAAATINTAVMTTADGEFFNSSRVGTRNIVVLVKINGDIERNRLALYRYASPKSSIRFFFKNGSRNVYIDGYVETHEVNLFENGQAAQISIICPQPFFKSIEDANIEFSSIVPQFKFSFGTNFNAPIPFSSVVSAVEKNIVNDGDAETGVIIELHAAGVVENPVIYDKDTREKFALTFTMNEGDVIRINTNTGEKSVILIRDGEESNIINYSDMNNDWFKLRYGDNKFTYSCETGYEFLDVKMIFSNKFEGV